MHLKCIIKQKSLKNNNFNKYLDWFNKKKQIFNAIKIFLFCNYVCMFILIRQLIGNNLVQIKDTGLLN
jgi:hypothetical protein